MKKVTINEAIKALEQDKTAHKITVIFAVGNNHPELATEHDRVLGNIVKLDAGKCNGIKSTVYRLATCSMLGGIYLA